MEIIPGQGPLLRRGSVLYLIFDSTKVEVI